MIVWTLRGPTNAGVGQPLLCKCGLRGMVKARGGRTPEITEFVTVQWQAPGLGDPPTAHLHYLKCAHQRGLQVVQIEAAEAILDHVIDVHGETVRSERLDD